MCKAHLQRISANVREFQSCEPRVCADFVCWAEWENEKTSVEVINALESVLETVQVPCWGLCLTLCTEPVVAPCIGIDHK